MMHTLSRSPASNLAAIIASGLLAATAARLVVWVLVAVLGLMVLINARPANAQMRPACNVGANMDGIDWRWAGAQPANCQELTVIRTHVEVPNTGWIVNTPTPWCAPEVQSNLGKIWEAIQSLATGDLDRLRRYAGDLATVARTRLAEHFRQKVGGDVWRFIETNLLLDRRGEARCGTFAIVVPGGAEVRGIRAFHWSNEAGMAGCPLSGDCANGFAGFLQTPVAQTRAGVQMVTAIFGNWSHDRRQTAHVFVFFRPPPGVQIINEL